MGNISTCADVQQKPLINTEQSISVTGNGIEQKIEYINKRNKISEAKMRPSIIETKIDENLLLADDMDFDSELFYCWVTSDFKDKDDNQQANEWQFNQDAQMWTFTFKFHITDKFRKGFYEFRTTYTKIQQIYTTAYNCRKKYFPQSRFSTQFGEDHKHDKRLELMDKYMVLYDVLWAEQNKAATQKDVQTCCDVLIKLLNAPLYIQKKSNIYIGLGMEVTIRDLLQDIAKKYMDSLAAKAKAHKGNDSQLELWKNTKWSHLTFHTVSLVERPNNNVSSHWGIRFEGDRYILSLDWFIKDAVYYRIVKNDAIGQKISWYSWIKQSQFIHHWSERVRVPIKNWVSEITNDEKNDKPHDISFYDVGRLVNMWKLIINNKYHVFDNNCQHFARDILSVFAVNAAKQLTDSTQNVFISANMTLTTELERVDQISRRLKQQLIQDYNNIKNEQIFLWLKQIGLPQYYYILKVQNIGLDMLRAGVKKSNALSTMQHVIVDEEHRQQILGHIIGKYPDNWEGIKSLLDDLNLKLYVIEKFKQQGINDIDTFCDLNDKELNHEIGIHAFGNRKKIIKAIEKLQLCRNKM